jgi:hypothetical protein
MKCRHAAALSVLGWYLMVPPSMSETNWVCGASLVATVSHASLGLATKRYAHDGRKPQT